MAKELTEFRKGMVAIFNGTKSDSKPWPALIVSDDAHCLDRLVSGITLNVAYRPGLIQIKNKAFVSDENPEGIMFLDPGKVTYIDRGLLEKPMFKISEQKQETIDRALARRFGIKTDSSKGKDAAYKEMYYELLNRVTEAGGLSR